MLKNKSNKLNNVKKFVKKNALPLLTGLVCAAMMFMPNIALADSATDIMSWLIRVLGALILILGLFFGLTGLVSYASAHAEGDGPAQNKATGKMSGGVMLIALSIIIIAAAPTLATKISTSVTI